MSDSPQSSGGSPPEWLVEFVKWAGSDPWDFVTKLLLLMSPLFLISAFLAYKLSNMIDSKETKKKQTKKKQKNLKNLRRSKID